MNIIASIIIAALFVPQGTEDQILVNPLKKGEIAYVNGATGESYMYIGVNDKYPNRIVDESALRGYEYEELDRDDFVVMAVSNLTRNASADILSFNQFVFGKTNTFVFTFNIPSHIKFDDVEFKALHYMQFGNHAIRDITKIVSGNVVTVKIVDPVTTGDRVEISNFKVIVKRYGDPSYVNDLTKKKIVIKDTASKDKSLRVGNTHLGMWRQQLLHYYDGNRGEHWSAYPASNNVIMVDHEIRFGDADKGLSQYAIGQDTTNSNVVKSTVYGNDAVRYYASESTINPTGINFTSIDVGDDTVTFTLNVSNVVFDASYLKLYATDEIPNYKSRWHQVGYTLTSSNPITITTPKGGKTSFYRVSYGNSHVVVEIADTLKVDRLILKGDNGLYYRIGINSSGVLTATVAQ